MPWYLGSEEVNGDNPPELFWIWVQNESLSKLREDIDKYIKEEAPSDCEVRIRQSSNSLDAYVAQYSSTDEGTFEWHVVLEVIRSSHPYHSESIAKNGRPWATE